MHHYKWVDEGVISDLHFQFRWENTIVFTHSSPDKRVFQGLRTEGVVCCTDCKDPEADLWFWAQKIKLTSLEIHRCIDCNHFNLHFWIYSKNKMMSNLPLAFSLCTLLCHLESNVILLQLVEIHTDLMFFCELWKKICKNLHNLEENIQVKQQIFTH